MKTKLNNDLDNLYKSNPQSVTIKEINTNIGDISQVNDYGNISHAIVNYEYDYNWILTILDILFTNKINVNYKAKLTGYTYIHLALYGYTDQKNNDKSYPTDFIVKLIKLGRKYGFDVNSQDKDGDSIVHAAIASEVYTGEIVPIIEALGPNFNLDIKDNNNRGIKEALDFYIEEAKSSQNKAWYNRLIREKDAILLYFDSQNLDDFKNKYQSIFEDISLINIVNNLDNITKLEQVIIKIVEFNNKKNNNKIDINSYLNIYHNKVINNILITIKENLIEPKKIDVDCIEKLIVVFKVDVSNDLKSIKEKYSVKLNKVKQAILSAKTIESIDYALNLINKFNITTDDEKTYFNTEKEKLNNYKNKLNKLIEEIKSNYNMYLTFIEWLKTNTDQDISEYNIDITNLDKFEEQSLLKLLDNLNISNIELKKKILLIIKEKLAKIFNTVSNLCLNGLLKQEEIFELLTNIAPTLNNQVRKKNLK